MVSSHLISHRSFLNSVLEKKLAIALKTLLILEASAKLVFIVYGTLIEKGRAPRLPSLDYTHIYFCFQSLWLVLPQTIQYA